MTAQVRAPHRPIPRPTPAPGERVEWTGGLLVHHPKPKDGHK